MPPKEQTLLETGDETSVSLLEKGQVRLASSALLKHLKSAAGQKEDSAKTKNLLVADADSEPESIWLICTTKKHIVPQKRLKPSKILLPHSLYTSTNLSICLITPDPQRAFKDAIAHPSAPQRLQGLVTRVIDIKKLEKKYHSYESKRQLLNSHDLFLADDRIITYLPKLLGKTFYTSTLKRPIPVCLQPSKSKDEKTKKNAALPSTKPKKEKSDTNEIIAPAKIAQAIDRTLAMTMVNLTPSATTAVRVGLSSFSAEQLAENIETVGATMVDSFVPKKWKGVKSIHIKGPNTMALPIWQTDELWLDEGQILEPEQIEQRKAEEARQIEERKEKKKQKKRKTLEAADPAEDEEGVEEGKVADAGDGDRETKKKKRKTDDAGLSAEMKERRERLRQQKKEVRSKLDAETVKSPAIVAT